MTSIYNIEISGEIARLNNLLDSYEDNPTIQAALQGEIDRLTDQQSSITGNIRVQVVELEDIEVKTGDIRLRADHIEGAGALTARGDAQITIENHSPVFLRLNRLLIPHHQGGYLFVNGIRAEENTQINARNKGGGGDAQFTIVERDDTPDPSIVIRNEFDPSNPSDNINNLPNLLAPDIQVHGDIENLDGGISLFNEAGSVVSSGHINGDTVSITSGQDFVQNYVSGVYHLGAYPMSLVSDNLGDFEQLAWLFRSLYDENNNSYLFNHSGDLTLPRDPSSLISANEIVIAAEVLNINGHIRSGIPNFSVNITNSRVNSSGVIAARTAYHNAVANGQSVSDLKYYQLTGGDESPHRIKTFLNFETDEIEVSDTAVRGGFIQLTGRIISTGNGKIEALDGYGRIKIDNKSTKTLVLRELDTGGDINGKIVITDTGRTGANDMSLQTIYTRNGNSLKVVSNQTVDSDGHANHTVSTSSGRTAVYIPRSGQRYNRIAKSDELVEETRKYTTRRNSIGDVVSFNANEVSSISSEVLSHDPTQWDGEGFVSEESNNDDYTFKYEREMTDETRISYDTSERCVRRVFGVCVKRGV